MDHLTEEQFEDLLQGKLKADEHLEQCTECRKRLTEKEALAGRLREAFVNVEVSSDFAEQLRKQIQETSSSAKTVRITDHPGLHRRRNRILSGLAAAAVLMIVAIPVGIYVSDAKQAQASQSELVKMHDMHVNADPSDLLVSNDPEILAAHLKNELGFKPHYPKLGQGLNVRACCVHHFQGKMVGSYVVGTTGKDIISIIVVTDTPKKLGMKKMDTPDETGHQFWKSSYAHCRMVTVRLDKYSYCAVGVVEHQQLYDILRRLLP
jgi:hypothetical protein